MSWIHTRLFEALLESEDGSMRALTTEEACARAGVDSTDGKLALLRMWARDELVSLRYGYNGGRVWRLASAR